MQAKKRTCKFCKARKPIEEMVINGLAAFCNYGHLMDFSKSDKGRAKVNRAVKVEKDQQFKALKDKVKDEGLESERKKTGKSYNRWLKLERIYFDFSIGLQPKCISCSKPWTEHNNDDFACGHYVSVGSDKNMQFNTWNTWLQCNMVCNSMKSANKSGDKHSHGFDRGLILRLGDNEFYRVMRRIKRNRIRPKYNRQDYERCRKWLDARWRVLKVRLAI